MLMHVNRVDNRDPPQRWFRSAIVIGPGAPPTLLLLQEARASSDSLPKGRAVNDIEDTPDRRYWTAYDHFKIEQEARAMRAAAMHASALKLWQRLRAAFAHAGAQPVKRSRTAGA
jgi:hypothetical protein